MLALGQAWSKLQLSLEDAPSKGAFSDFRCKVSSAFFKDVFEEDLNRLRKYRSQFSGLYVYAIDGDELALPASEKILAEGYRGSKLAGNKETHYPKMITVQAVDVINGLVTCLEHSGTSGEYTLGSQMARRLEKDSVAIYDRLYCTYDVVSCHIEAENFFIIRVPTEKNIQREIRNFVKSRERSQVIDLNPPLSNPNRPVHKVRLIKARNPRNKEDLVLMTNLDEKNFTDLIVEKLYRRRWDIETSFKDLTSTLKMTEWRSQNLNSILQEIYALLWLVNQIRCRSESLSRINHWLSDVYFKSNFKNLVKVFSKNLELLCAGRLKAFLKIFDYWARRTRERRERLSRCYDRVIKTHRSKYASGSLITRRGP